MLERMRRQTEDIVRYYGEIDRRIAGTGTDGVVGLLTMSRQLESAIAVIGSQEIEWVVSEIRRLLDELVQIDAQLERVRQLKIALSDDGPDVELPRRRI
jgi:hypothetical protein